MNDNNDCCKNLLLNKIIVADNVGVRAPTYINKRENLNVCQENTIVNNFKSTLVTAPIAVDHCFKQFIKQVIKTCAYNNRYALCDFDKDQDILYQGTMFIV